MLILRALLIVAGLASLAYGLYQITEWLPFVVLGALAVAGGLLYDDRDDQ